MVDEPNSGRELLGRLIGDSCQCQRTADELGVNPLTLARSAKVIPCRKYTICADYVPSFQH